MFTDTQNCQRTKNVLHKILPELIPGLTCEPLNFEEKFTFPQKFRKFWKFPKLSKFGYLRGHLTKCLIWLIACDRTTSRNQIRNTLPKILFRHPFKLKQGRVRFNFSGWSRCHDFIWTDQASPTREMSLRRAGRLRGWTPTIHIKFQLIQQAQDTLFLLRTPAEPALNIELKTI